MSDVGQDQRAGAIRMNLVSCRCSAQTNLPVAGFTGTHILQNAASRGGVPKNNRIAIVHRYPTRSNIRRRPTRATAQ